MPNLSMPTVILSYAIFSAISTFVLARLWSQNHNRFSGLEFWVANSFMQLAATVLIALRGHIPDFASIIVGNIMTAGGILSLYIGMEEFLGKRSSQTHNYILLTLFVLAQAYFTYVQSNQQIRNINCSIIYFLLACQAIWLIFLRTSVDQRSEMRGLGYITAAFGVINLIRIANNLIMPAGNDLLNANSHDILIILSLQMLFIVLTFGLILTVNHRLIGDLGNDIIERQQVESALREREALYRQMFTDHTAVMLLINPDSGQIVEANPAAARFYGYPLEILQQMNIDQINMLPSAKVAKDRQAAAAGNLNYFLFSHRLASQEIRDVEVHSVPVQIEGSTLLYSIIHDVTERKQAEDALLESEEKFHTAFHASPVVMAISTLEDGNFIDINSRFYQLTGYERNEILGHTSTELGLWSDEERECVLKELKDYGYAHNKEVNLITKSGDEIPILWFGDMVNLDGKPCLISSAYDLRKQKQAEAKINFQAKMLDTVNQAVIATDLEGKIIYLNSYAETLYGWRADEAIGKIITDVTVPEIALKQAQEIMDALSQGESWAGEFQVQHKDGCIFPAFVSDTPIFDDSGEIVGVVGISMDITERKQIERQLSILVERLDLATRSANLGIWDWYIPEDELVWDDRMYALYGLQREDFSGAYNAWLAGIHPDDQVRCNKAIQQVLKGEKEYELEFRVLWPGGTIRFIKAYGQIVRDTQGNPLRMIGINYDITESKTSEMALRENENRLRTIFEASQAGIILVDSKGVITFANQRMADMFGCLLTELIGSTYPEHVYPEQRQVGNEKMKQLIAGNIDSIALERHYIRKDGSDFWGLLSGRRQEDENGKLVSLVGIIADITEKTQAEEATRAALRDKEVLLRELYHRTKNNMQVISSMLNLEISQSDNETLIKTLKDMDSRIRSMALVHQKLYQSQSLSSIDLQDYLSDLVDLIVANYQITPERVTVSMNADSVPVLIDTAIPCGLIVNEILSNTMKYAFPTKKKGEIKIHLSRSTDAENAKIILAISDNGIGVPPGKDLRHSSTLGVQTIFGIARHQLNADVNLETNHGVAWRFQFEDDLYRSRV